MKHIINKIFHKPCVCGVVGDVNTGKSMLIYSLLKAMRKQEFSLYTFGLRTNLYNATEIYSLAEIEQVKNGVIIVDEFSILFDLENRKQKKQIETTLRLIHHNNNVMILCGVPENFKKFISGKLNFIFYKKTLMSDLINGSRVKSVLAQYKGYEMGTEVLNLENDEVLFFDGVHYQIEKVKYYKEYDSKRDNISILRQKNVSKNVQKMCK